MTQRFLAGATGKRRGAINRDEPTTDEPGCGEGRGHPKLSFGDTISEMPLDSPVHVAAWIQGGGLG